MLSGWSCSSIWHAAATTSASPTAVSGPRTRNALRAFQQAVGAMPDGFATAAILERLRSR